MKKFYAIFAAALMCISVFAAKDVVPSDAVLADYYDASQVCVCIFVPADMACYDVVLTGSFNGWKTTEEDCIPFEAVEGYDGWYVAAYEPEAEPDEFKGLQAKPIMKDGDGKITWAYQVGAATVIRGGVQVVAGYEGEIDLISYGTDAPNVYTVDAWKMNPCTAVYHNYTVVVYNSTGCEYRAVPFIVGAFNNWDGFQQMQLDAAKSKELGKRCFYYSFKAAEGSEFYILSGLLAEDGQTIEGKPDWKDEAYLQEYNADDDEWIRLTGEGSNGNLVLGTEPNLQFDFSDPEKYRWARCVQEEAEYVVLGINLPAANCPEAVEIIGTFDNWAGTAMEHLDNGWWFAELEVRPSDYFKIRGAGSWDQVIEIYNAEDDTWAKIADGQFKFGKIWTDDTYKGTPCKWIELDWSDPALARWSVAGEGGEPSEPKKYYNVNLLGLTEGYIDNEGDWHIYGNWSGTLPENTYIEISCRPNCGTFERWSDGITDSYRSFYLTQDTTISAVISGIETYQVSITAGEHGYVYNAFVGERTSCQGSLYVEARANEGYHFAGWSDGAKDSYRSINIYSDTTVYAIFHEGEYGGRLGENVWWKYSVNSQTMTIYGSGEMDYNYDNSFYNNYSDRCYDSYSYACEVWTAIQNTQTVVIEEGVTNISYALFQGLDNLQHVSIPASVQSIGGYAFGGCTNLTSFALPNTVTEVGYGILYRSGVTTPVYNNTLFAYMPPSMIGTYAVPEGIHTICAGSFSYSQLTSVVLPQSLRTIDSEAFGGSNLPAITIPEGVTSIGSRAFRSCGNLASIEIPNSVTSIGYDAFENCSSLKSLEFPSSLVYLEDRVIAGCTSMETVKIPSSVLSIGEYNRQLCESGEQEGECYDDRYFEDRYTIAGSLRNYSYEYGWYVDDYNYLTNLKTVEAPAWFFDVPEDGWTNSPKYLEKVVVNRGELNDNVLGVIKRSYKTLLSLNVASVSNTSLADEAFKDNYNLQELVLPANLTSVSYMAVAGCKNLKAIDIPASVEIINQSAFEDCRSIESITFGGKQPASVSGRQSAKAADSKLRIIANWAFYNAHQLQHLEIPEGVEEIGDGAFYGCTYLQDLSLPSSVRSIGDNCFALCSKLKMITVNSTTPPQICPRTFYDVSRQIPVYVPEDVVADYKNDDIWGQMNIQGMETAVENISADDTRYTKLIIDGQLYIMHNGKTYTIQGQEVK